MSNLDNAVTKVQHSIYKYVNATEPLLGNTDGLSKDFPDEDELKEFIRQIRMGEINASTHPEVEWSNYIDATPGNQGTIALRKEMDELKIESLKTKIQLAFTVVESSRSELKTLLANQHSPGGNSKLNLPIKISSHEDAEPPKWKAQSDKRSPAEYLKAVKSYMTIVKCVQPDNINREVSRLVRSSLPKSHEDSFNSKWSSWEEAILSDGTGRIPNQGTVWPTADLIESWLKETITDPVSAATKRQSFNLIKQLKPGLTGYDSYKTKFNSDYSRCQELLKS